MDDSGGEPGEHREHRTFAPAAALEALAARVTELERELTRLRLDAAAQPASPPQPAAPLQSASPLQPSAPAQPNAPAQPASATAPPPTAPPHPRPAPPPPPPEAPLPPPPPASAPPPQASPAPPARTLEERFGSQLFNLIGIVALFIAASLALKLAVDQGLVGPPARVLLGVLAGTAILLWSERFRRRGLNAFSWSLKTVGTGVLYLSLWAAYQLFHLLPAAVALAAMLLVTAWNAFMAWSQDAELLAVYALAGGFATPLLLATGGNHELFLFTYLAGIDLALVLLVRAKPWQRLLLPALAVTALYFVGWYWSFFKHPGLSHNLHQVTPLGQLDRLFWQTVLFLLVFAAIFAAVSLRGFRARTTGLLVPVLVPLANAAFLSLGLYSVFADSGLGHTALAWLMVALAAVYLGLVRVQASALAAATHLACAVVLLTVAIPLQAHGHSLTTAWLVEGLVLSWIASRLTASTPTPTPAPTPTPTHSSDRDRDPAPNPDRDASPRVLQTLAAVGYALGLVALTFQFTLGAVFHAAPERLLSANLGTSLVASLTLAGAALLATRRQQPAPAFAALTALAWVALLLSAGELFANRATPAFSPAFARALLGLALLVACAWAAQRLARTRFRHSGLLRLAAALAVLANLVALLSGVRVLNALFANTPESGLERSLATSAWLMAYAAALLTAGFLRRSAFTRWQALLLLLFTILKVFLYDLSALSQGYRIVSVFALGALLMGISLAYQRDWLGLRAAPTPQQGPR